jgi:hypothetical protein
MGGDASMVAIDTSAVTDLVLVRLSGEAGGRLALGRLTRALEPYVAHRLSHSQWRELLDEVLGNLVARQLIVCDGARVALTGVGWTRSWRMFAWPVPRSARWPELRDVHLPWARGASTRLEVACDCQRTQIGRPIQGVR